MTLRALLAAILVAPLLAGCGARDDGIIDVAIIGSEESVFSDGLRLSPGGQHVRAATQSGLVALDAQGEVIPALAERWIPTDDGLSFIFRLREGSWPDGSDMTAASARDALLIAIRGLEGTSLGIDLAPIEDVRAMAGRVIEIRLSHPEPYILHLLAQPELALRQPGGATGPMTLARDEEGALLAFKAPEERGLPFDENWQEGVLEIRLQSAGAQEAIELFDQGEVELVIGGTLGNLPLVETGPLSSGTLRIDSTVGLFGLLVRRDDGLLGNEGVREGLAMAIDRSALLAQFNIGGWTPTTRPVSPGLPADTGRVLERWQGQSIESLRAEAAGRIAAWRSQFDEGDRSQPATVSISLGQGPGWDLLYSELAEQLATIGIRLVREEDRARADLVLLDRVARYPAPRWFLNQFHCSLRRGLCLEEIDAMVASAAAQASPDERAMRMAEAEAAFTLANIFIPIASPLRWSLARGSVDGFEPNPWAFHPLPALAEIPR